MTSNEVPCRTLWYIINHAKYDRKMHEQSEKALLMTNPQLSSFHKYRARRAWAAIASHLKQWKTLNCNQFVQKFEQENPDIKV